VVFKENVWLTNKDNESLVFRQNWIIAEVVDFDTVKKICDKNVFYSRVILNLELRDRILVKHSNDFSHAFSLPLCLEFMDKTVDKSVAVARILKIENFNFDETILVIEYRWKNVDCRWTWFSNG
jgi:hydroxymethylpyrimidine pyrophosphatase-like HAD family hydrolase